MAGCNPAAKNQSGAQQETPGGQGGEQQGGNSGEHVHNYGELIPEQPATCKKEGFQAHYYCEGCEKYFDSEKHETTVEQLKIDIDPNSHNYIFKCGQTEHWQVCVDCGEETAHTPHSVSDGVCPACGYVEKCTEGLKFTEIKENEEIIGYSVSKGTATDSHIFIPSFYNNLPVLSLYNNLPVLSLSFDYSYINGGAFSGCESLTEITIGNSVTSIGDCAFEDCKSLQGIIIPDSVTSIGDRAFIGCTSLEEIKISAGVTSIGMESFAYCERLTEITFPASVTSIGDIAFLGCTSLTEITLPASVTSIGMGMFDDCRSLTKITIPDSVTAIGERAFRGCTSLTEITVPAGVTSIGIEAFAGCESLEGVNIKDIVAWCNIDFRDNPLLYVQNLYLKGQLVTYLEIPNEVTAIKDYVFAGCTSLTEIIIPDSVTSIGMCAFLGCTSLESISVDTENKVYRSEGNCIMEKESKTLIVGCKTSKIPEGVASIGGGAFQYCGSLTEITIPHSVTSIGSNAFSDCTSLKEITIPDSVTSIDGEAFYGCISLESITVDKENKVYRSEGNCIIEKETKTVIVGCKTSKIPEGVTSIGDWAFSGCESLEEITIPASVTFIGRYAFWNCTSLEKVIFENAAGWKISQNSNMSNPEDINVSDPEQNAEILKEISKYGYYWKRG